MSKRNAKDIILHLKLQSAKDEWNQDRMKRLDFINKRLREKNEGRATTLMRQCLSTIQYLSTSVNRFLPSIKCSKKW